jgi:hypothetical protein
MSLPLGIEVQDHADGCNGSNHCKSDLYCAIGPFSLHCTGPAVYHEMVNGIALAVCTQPDWQEDVLKSDIRIICL